jgi:hypothetical protein
MGVRHSDVPEDHSSKSVEPKVRERQGNTGKPRTAGEITELLNRDLEQGDRALQEKDVAEWLRNNEDKALTLYWSKTRLRK